jgi:hypothetical protein
MRPLATWRGRLLPLADELLPTIDYFRGALELLE